MGCSLGENRHLRTFCRQEEEGHFIHIQLSYGSYRENGKRRIREIDFTSDYSWETTDRGSNVFKIFSTIKDILTKIISELKVHTIVYSASGKKESIYKKLIQSVYPNAKFSINQYNSIEASIKAPLSN